MNKIEIDIDDYLTEEDKKELCKEYVRETLRGDSNHKERVLSNMAYGASYKILDDSLTSEDMSTIKAQAKKALLDKNSYLSVFRKKDAWGGEDSEAYLEVKKAVKEHKHLISDLVKKTITDRDYHKDLDNNADYIGDVLIDALKKGLDDS